MVTHRVCGAFTAVLLLGQICAGPVGHNIGSLASDGQARTDDLLAASDGQTGQIQEQILLLVATGMNIIPIK